MHGDESRFRAQRGKSAGHRVLTVCSAVRARYRFGEIHAIEQTPAVIRAHEHHRRNRIRCKKYFQGPPQYRFPPESGREFIEPHAPTGARRHEDGGAEWKG